MLGQLLPDVHTKLHLQVLKYACKAETARLRRILRPQYRVLRLSRFRDAVWAHAATRRLDATFAAFMAPPTL